jgi:hypothetical protein
MRLSSMSTAPWTPGAGQESGPSTSVRLLSLDPPPHATYSTHPADAHPEAEVIGIDLAPVQPHK